jgi:hypothetical protein
MFKCPAMSIFIRNLFISLSSWSSICAFLAVHSAEYILNTSLLHGVVRSVVEIVVDLLLDRMRWNRIYSDLLLTLHITRHVKTIIGIPNMINNFDLNEIKPLYPLREIWSSFPAP